LVVVGQLATTVMVGFGLAWIPLMKGVSAEIYNYLQSVQAYISPPITAVFFLGLLWKRINRHGAIVSLVAGFVLGMGRLALELSRSQLNETGWLYQLATINFLHFAILLFVVCTVLLIAVSLLTPPEDERKLAGLTFATTPPAAPLDITDEQRRAHRMNVGLTLLLAGLVGAIWIYFRG
jgi:SSS family solute:Na+ symporter